MLPFPSLLLSLLSLLTLTTAQAFYMFEYFIQNTGCTQYVSKHSANAQTIVTMNDGQCVPVANALSGTFDVRISGKIYWTNGLTPVLKACPTIDCDIYADNGCYTMWEKGKWPGLSTCRRMTETYYWAIGPMGFVLGEKEMRHGERINGSYTNGTDHGGNEVRSNAE